MAAAFLLACSGADGDPAPAAVEAGSDSGVVIIVSCADGRRNEAGPRGPRAFGAGLFIADDARARSPPTAAAQRGPGGWYRT